MLYFPLLSLFKYDVSEGGVPKILIFADRGGGGGVQKGPKYADVILEPPLISIFHTIFPIQPYSFFRSNTFFPHLSNMTILANLLKTVVTYSINDSFIYSGSYEALELCIKLEKIAACLETLFKSPISIICGQ